MTKCCHCGQSCSVEQFRWRYDVFAYDLSVTFQQHKHVDKPSQHFNIFASLGNNTARYYFSNYGCMYKLNHAHYLRRVSDVVYNNSCALYNVGVYGKVMAHGV